MSCGCGKGNDKSTLERLQGYQRGNYGFGARYVSANQPLLNNNTVLPYNAHPAPGNIGYRYAAPINAPAPVVNPGGYAGNLPLSQQPKINLPQPYSYRYF